MNKGIGVALVLLAIAVPLIWFVEYIPIICPPNLYCADLNGNGGTSFHEQMLSWDVRRNT